MNPFTNKTYDWGKYIATIALPALATLYSGLGILWQWPNTTEVVATINLINTALGSLLMISNASYKKNNEPEVAVDILEPEYEVAIEETPVSDRDPDGNS